MTNQPVLPSGRDFDLPPKWDGRVVVWTAWESLDADGPVFICPPPRRPAHCPACASQSRPLISRGRVAASSLVTLEAIQQRDAARERLPLAARFRLPALALVELAAFRCPECGSDQVLDLNEHWWSLDETDYRAEGSWEQ